MINVVLNLSSLQRHFAIGLAAFMLLASSASVAAPVSVSFERNAHYWGLHAGADNLECSTSPIAALLYASQSLPYCNGSSYELTLAGDGSYGDVRSTATVGWHYDSEAVSAENSFSLLASNRVYASAATPIYDPEEELGYPAFYPGRAIAQQRYYWTEFVVTAEVLYTGSLALTDGQLQNGGCWPGAGGNQDHCYDEQLKYSSSGNVYTQGSILGPGTYQYWNLGGFEQISLHADYGQTLTASLQQDYAFTFTTVVPIPAAVWLFASGLGLLGWLSRRAC